MNGELTITAETWLPLLMELNNQIRGRDIAVERPADFFDKVIDLADRLSKAHRVPRHLDPNLAVLWHASLLLGTWVETIGNAKLYDPNRTNLTDERRREIRKWLAELPQSAASAARLGATLGKEFQRRQTPYLLDAWES